MNNKILTLALLAVLCSSCSSSDDSDSQATELYKSDWLDLEAGVPGKHVRSDITLAIKGDNARLNIESEVEQGSNTWHVSTNATGNGASSTKFMVSTHDTVYTCTRQSADAIRLERTKPTYYDYDTLDKQ